MKAQGKSRNRIRLVTGTKGHTARGRYPYFGEPWGLENGAPICPRPGCGRTMKLMVKRWSCPKRGCLGARRIAKPRTVKPVKRQKPTPNLEPKRWQMPVGTNRSPYPPTISEALEALLNSTNEGRCAVDDYRAACSVSPADTRRVSLARSAIVAILRLFLDDASIDEQLPPWSPPWLVPKSHPITLPMPKKRKQRR